MKNEYGIDTSSHRSRLLTLEDANEAYIIIPVKRDLAGYISKRYPQTAAKIQLFSTDISDPWRQPYPVYQKCAQLVDQMVTEILEQLIKTIS